VNGFIDHLYTRLGTTSNYSATSYLHNSQITTAPAKPFPACCVIISRSLATASNSGDSSASRAQVLSSQPPLQNWTNDWLSSLAYNISARTTYKTPRFQQQLYFCVRIRCRGNVFTEPLPRNGRCLQSLHSNGSVRHIIYRHPFFVRHTYAGVLLAVLPVSLMRVVSYRNAW
jgi:hypothetical protein